MKQEHINEIKGFIVLALGLILLASLISFTPDDLSWYTSNPNIPPHNYIRGTGAHIAGALLFIFGLSSYALVVFLFFISWNKFTSREIRFSSAKFISFFIFFCVLSALFSMLGSQESAHKFERAGIVGTVLSDFLVYYLGRMGAYIILSTLGILTFILTAELLVFPYVLRLVENLTAIITKTPPKAKEKTNAAVIAQPKIAPKPAPNLAQTLFMKNKIAEEEKKLMKVLKPEDKILAKPIVAEVKPLENKDIKPKIKIAQQQPTTPQKFEQQEKPQQAQPTGVKFIIPTLDLLDNPPVVSNSKIENNLMSDAKLLEETLSSFGVMANVVDIERGPAITRYELEPAAGVKVQKFMTLSNDIALAMKASTVRIVAPIPGKNRVGIEVPNDSSASVYLKDVLSSPEFKNSKSKLTIALGKDIAGKSMVADLADMPHMLIAGTTGSGKSVCVNGIIMSILFNATPNEVKFVMVDPKMVELAQFNDIPHLLCPTVTDAKKASAVLGWVVGEMESRYRTLSKAGVKNIKGYNEKGNNMHYIVVIIDELADLMQVSAKTVESAIMRLAQLSRAVGIHLILATQRPSVNVITGVIKANFPARISFKVASKVDSRTVLDMNGAESLLGKGDMLFVKPGDAKPTRGQCNYVKDEEIGRVIKFIKEQQAPLYDETILNTQQASATGVNNNEKDEYYDEAVKLVMETNQASVSILQRRMRLGYTRAARLIDMMEHNGLVGPYVGSKPRDILIDREQWLLENMKEDKKQEQTQQAQ